MADRLLRRKSVPGLTSKERLKQLQSLDGAQAFSPVLDQSDVGQGCQRCAERKKKIVELEKEFADLRKVLISQKRVIDVSDKPGKKGSTRGREELALIQESAKLRITIDTLMRFQVC